MGTVVEKGAKTGKIAEFFKQNIVMNASLAYGIFLGITVGRYLIGGIRRSEEGVLLYFLTSFFSLILLLSAFWGKADKDKIEAERSWRKRYFLHLKEPYGAWALLFGYMLGATIWRFF